jgi:hypothetical protein
MTMEEYTFNIKIGKSLGTSFLDIESFYLKSTLTSERIYRSVFYFLFSRNFELFLKKDKFKSPFLFKVLVGTHQS